MCWFTAGRALVKHDDVLVSSVLLSHAQSKIVGLWPVSRTNTGLKSAISTEACERINKYLPRVNKVKDTELTGQGGGQTVCVQDYVVVQETRICVQEVHLCRCGLCDTGVTVAHCDKKGWFFWTKNTLQCCQFVPLCLSFIHEWVKLFLYTSKHVITCTGAK